MNSSVSASTTLPVHSSVKSRSAVDGRIVASASDDAVTTCTVAHQQGRSESARACIPPLSARARTTVAGDGSDDSPSAFSARTRTR